VQLVGCTIGIFSPQSFEKFSNIKFRQIPSNDPSCFMRAQGSDETSGHCTNVVNAHENLKCEEILTITECGNYYEYVDYVFVSARMFEV
jgi:hypothetical protein